MLARKGFEGRCGVAVRQRTCQMCGESFEVERKRGRPRSRCFDCQPVGWKLTRVRGRWKLRRNPAAFSWAELRRPRSPASLPIFRSFAGRLVVVVRLRECLEGRVNIIPEFVTKVRSIRLWGNEGGAAGFVLPPFGDPWICRPARLADKLFSD